MEIRPRLVAPLITLLAIIPGALFILDRGETFVVLSAVSVVLIAASLYLIFSPTDGGHADSGDDDPFPG